jgi:hypothetical protein
MHITDATWEQRVADLWQRIDDCAPDQFIAQLELRVARLGPGNASGLFERALAQDSIGRRDIAVPLYRAALAAGLTGLRRRRATIQMASSPRNLGNAEGAAALLAAELDEPAA